MASDNANREVTVAYSVEGCDFCRFAAATVAVSFVAAVRNVLVASTAAVKQIKRQR